MTQINTLLELRTKIKENKPDFIRQDNPKRMKLNDKWRKTKGIHSKIRHKFKGRRKMPSPGYKSPVLVKGLHFSGLKIVNINSINRLENIKKENEGIIISKSVGKKKKLEILNKAKALDIKVLNLNIDEQIKKIEDFISSKKKKEAKPAKEIKKEETEKLKEITEDTKKEAEKREKDRVLTKRT